MIAPETEYDRLQLRHVVRRPGQSSQHLLPYWQMVDKEKGAQALASGNTFLEKNRKKEMTIERVSKRDIVKQASFLDQQEACSSHSKYLVENLICL